MHILYIPALMSRRTVLRLIEKLRNAIRCFDMETMPKQQSSVFLQAFTRSG